MPKLNIDGVGRVSVPDDQWSGLSSAEQDDFVKQIVSGHHPEVSQEPPKTTTNPIEGALGTAENIGGNVLDLLGKGRAYTQEHVFGTPDDQLAASTRKFGQSLVNNDHQFDDGETVRSAYDKDGLLGAAKHVAGEAIASSPHILAASGPWAPLTMAVDAAAQTNQNAQERAKNDGRTEAGASDYLAGGATAAAQEFLNRVGAKALVAPVGGSVLGRTVAAVATDAATGAGSGAAQYLGTHADTQKGATWGGTGDAALEGGAVGAAGGAMARGAMEGGQGAQNLKEARDLREGNKALDATPEQAQSNLRVADVYDKVRQSTERGETDGLVAKDSDVFKTGKAELGQRVKDLADDMHRAGVISKDEHGMLVGDDNSPYRQAIVHNRAFGADQLDKVDLLSKATDDQKGLLRDAFRDLNTATYNSMYKNSSGPVEQFMDRYGGPATKVAAGAIGFTHPYAAFPLGFAGGKALTAVGKAVDHVMGYRTPPALQGVRQLRLAAEDRGLSPRDTLGDLSTESKTLQDQYRTQQQAQQAAVLAKVTAKQAAADLNKQLTSNLSPEAPILGGPVAEIMRMGKEGGVNVSREDIMAAVDHFQRSGALTADQAAEAKRGERFHGGLVPYLRQAATIAQARGDSVSPQERIEERAKKRAESVLVRKRAEELAQGMLEEQQRAQQGAATVAAARFITPDALQAATTALQGSRERAQATRAAKKEQATQGPSTAPQSPTPQVPPVTGPFTDAQTQGISNVPSYLATLGHRNTALGTALGAAPSPVLASLAHEVEAAKTKKAKATLVDKAEKDFAGDPVALEYIRGSVRALSKIGGKADEAGTQPKKTSATKVKMATAANSDKTPAAKRVPARRAVKATDGT